MPSNSKIFKYFLIFFIGGIFIGNFWQPQGHVFWLATVFPIVILAFDFKSRKNLFLFFCFLGFFLGVARISTEIRKIYPREEKEYQGVAKLTKEPVVKEEYDQLVLKDAASGEKFLANVPLYPRYEYGDELKVQCRLANSENKYPKFDYVKFLAKDGIYQICKNPKLEKLNGDGAGFKKSFFEKIKISYFSKLFLVKKSLENKISRIFPSPESEYLSGLILGGSERLDSQVAENFRRTGTTHTVAVSGYNITILAEFLMVLAITIGFWRPKAFWVAIVGIVFFVAMIGSPASAVRAAIMGILLLWAAKAGRLSDSFWRFCLLER
jgi:hypothetical protein